MKFKTKVDIDKYFSGDRIQCLVCRHWYKQLSLHIKLHDMNDDDYREKFGLPWTKGLCCHETSKKRSIAVKNRIESGELDVFSVLDKHRFKAHATNSRRKKPDYEINELKEAIKRNPASVTHKKWTDEDFYKIVRRAKEQKRSISDICRDSDLPSIRSWYRWNNDSI